ncbi:AAA family ATPase [Sodalis endosymbiont of Spalangia cameroni]|uniref:AAA family ATPase n=1 Tax=Sodalis praecaptivus TaxID=1239307 RepID=UPI0031F93546
MLNTLTEEEFFSGLYQVVHPSTPVAHSQGLCGRQREWRLLEQALSAPGRHALVYGAAGIGKTSLAHSLVAHHRLRCPPVKISCDPDSTLLSLMKHALTLGDSGMSRRHESVFGARFSLAGSGVKFEKKVVEQQCAAAIEDNAMVVTALEAWGERLQSPVWLIIDDLDRMAQIEERRGFLTLFKQLADRACPVKMILVARGEQPEGVFGAGETFTRHLSPVKLAPLTLKNGYEFISLCLDSFGLLMVERLKWRVAQACAGHPRKLHQVCERLLISAWERGGRHITPQQCQYALQCVRCVGPAPAGAGGHDASQSGDAPVARPEDV